MSENARIVLIVLAILVLGLLGYRLIFSGEDVTPLLVQAVEGRVSHVDPQGERSSLSPGHMLERLDRVETTSGGRAFLTMGGGSTLTVNQGTSVRVLDVSGDGVRVELDEGSVEATVRPERGSVGIVHRDRQVISTEGTFAVGVGSQGNMAVENHGGSLQLVGIDTVEGLAEGERLLLLADGTPRLAAIPESLLLEVAWPDSARTRQAEVAVRGLTDPGAEVRIGAAGHWTTVVADAEGHFEATVALEEGENPLKVVSRDPIGRSTTDETLVVRDTEPPPSATFEVEY